MSYEIVRLAQDDYEEAIDFMNLVFSMAYVPHNFPELLPAYYKPSDQHMQCHYAIRIDGKIRSLLGIYPTVLKAGADSLKVARIGAVSTHPAHEGQGMMKALMEYSMQLIENQEYDLGFLGGLRHRYLPYGFEKCGSKLLFSLSKHNFARYPVNSPWEESVRRFRLSTAGTGEFTTGRK